MTNDELDKLDALAAAATPGPWEGPSTEDHVSWLSDRKAGAMILLPDIGISQSFVWCSSDEPPSVMYPRMADYANAAFIAAARDAVPALVAEVRRLRRVESKAMRVVQADNDGDRAVAIVTLRSALEYDA